MEFKEELIHIPIKLYNKKPKRKTNSKIHTVYYYKYNEEKGRNEKIQAKIEATSKYFYKQDFMYRDTALSEQNDVFDYYKILKPNMPDKVAVKNLRVRNTQKNTTHSYITTFKKCDEPIILSFD